MKQPVKIIDSDFNLLGEIDDYESLIFTRSWSGIGGFEIHINANKVNTEQLQKENIIFLNKKKAGVILYREISTENNEQLVVRGLQLKSYMSRRITIPPIGSAYDYKNDYAENIIKHYVDVNCINPVTSKRIINKLVIDPIQNKGIKIQYQTRFKGLAEEIEKISLISGLGWDIYLDLQNKKFVFHVFEGRDLSSSQSLLPPAIFSIDYDNISSQQFINSTINYKNIGYIGGQGEGIERTIEIVGEDTEGLNRHEVFIDARDVEDDTRLADRGRQKLEEFKEVIAFDNDILTQSNLIYEKDYGLGDIITATNKKWNVTLDSRITEVTEIYEQNGFKINALFGNNIPNLIDKIKQELDSPLIEKGLLKQGENGTPGTPGINGVGLNYTWDGTELGVKREDETIYQYVNLKGEKGDQGERGEIGPSGTTSWNELADKPDTFSPSIHDHKSLYYDKTYINSHGLGEVNLVSHTVTDCNSANATGTYYALGGNSPTGGDGILIVASYSSEWKQQQFWEFGGKGAPGNPGRIYHRHKYFGTWQEWYQIYPSAASGGTKIITSATEPILSIGDQWHKEI